jgi:hypothetical protein
MLLELDHLITHFGYYNVMEEIEKPKAPPVELTATLE